MSERPVRLSDAFAEGYPRDIILRGASAQQSPSPGTAWLILSGFLEHITGTASILTAERVMHDGSLYPFFRTEIKAADASDDIPLFSNTPESIASQFQIVVLRSSDQLCFTGDATALVTVRVLEWRTYEPRGVGRAAPPGAPSPPGGPRDGGGGFGGEFPR